jgi:hypothetical protein
VGFVPKAELTGERLAAILGPLPGGNDPTTV